ncbi:MAG: hypothetical protein ACJ72N_28990 [Labedaea sp.]
MATSRWYARSPGNGAATVISWVGGIFALVEVLYILLVLFGANTANAFVQFIASIAGPLALFFPGLFNLANDKLELIVNYGLAAVFWLVVTGFLARLVARF